MKPPVLRWKRDKREPGLAAIMARPPAHNLRTPDGKVAARVYPHDRQGKLWYWVSGWDYSGVIPSINTCDAGFVLEDAKAAAMEWCKKHLTPK